MDSPIETTRHTLSMNPRKKYNQKVWAPQCPKISNAKIPSPEAGVYMCRSKSNKRLGCWSPRRKHRCSWPENGYAFFGCKNSALTSPKIVAFSDEVYVRKGPPKVLAPFLYPICTLCASFVHPSFCARTPFPHPFCTPFVRWNPLSAPFLRRGFCTKDFCKKGTKCIHRLQI